MGIKSTGSQIPAGTEVAYFGGVIPPGWLLEDNAEYLIADYPRLFGVIGNTYGGDGVLTFRTPDSRGRVTAGRDDMGGTPANRLTSAGSGLDGATLGAVGGGETVTLTVAQMPSHAHSLALKTTGTTVWQPGPSNGGAGNPVNTASNGSSGQHRTVQPSIVANKMIKT